MLGPDLVAWCTTRWSALETAPCGPARHNVPEDRPVAIAHAIAEWADRHDLRRPRVGVGAG